MFSQLWVMSPIWKLVCVKKLLFGLINPLVSVRAYVCNCRGKAHPGGKSLLGCTQSCVVSQKYVWTVPQRDILPLVVPFKFIELLTQPGTDRGETLVCVLTTGRGQMGRAPLNTGKRGGTGAR